MTSNTQADATTATQLAAMGREFWQWRHRQAPVTRDDICRVLRPAGWTARWSADDIQTYRNVVSDFTARLDRIDVSSASTSSQVDWRLLRSAILRAKWELDDVCNWAHNPSFYVDQSLGAVFDLLLRRPPFDSAYTAELLGRLAAVPAILTAGQANLVGHAFKEYGEVAVRELDGVAGVLAVVADALRPELPADTWLAVGEAFGTAAAALVSFSDWLAAGLADMDAFAPVGREKFLAFLQDIACISWSPDELASIGRQEWRRAVLMETLQTQRNAGRPSAYAAASAEAQCRLEAELEQQVRDFYSRTGLLTLPNSLGHYHNLPMPEYLWPLRWLGVTDDLTDQTRLQEDSVSYVPFPGPGLPYFHDTNARDPRIGIVHEGAHYMQLALSWGHQNPVRREFYDSIANEGIAYYNEELMIHAGFFDDAPLSLQVMYNLMRLRGLRVNVDIDLALGNITIVEAGERLRDQVPMDETTAFAEAAAFASTPGLGLSYVVGKHQIFAWIAALSLDLGDQFDLGDMHDFIWRNGNVPIELLRAEYSASLGHSRPPE